MKDLKPWYKSKLVWTGIFQCLGALSEATVGFLNSNPSLTLISILPFITGVLTIVFRFVTSATIEGSPASKARGKS